MTRNHLYSLGALALLFIGILWAQGPIKQPLEYHGFADARTLFGIPHFWNVASNLPIFLAGCWALPLVFKHFSLRPDVPSRFLPLLLCLGMIGAGIGSAYYHSAPDNNTLVWDRLPMTLMFMPLFSLFLYRYLNPWFGNPGLYVLVPLGILSVVYWHFTEQAGYGDLRPYIFVQFFPMVFIPVLLLFTQQKTPYTRYIWLVLGWYITAKIFEKLDHETYQVLGFWSGHTMKHILSGLGLYYVVRYFQEWEKELLMQKS